MKMNNRMKTLFEEYEILQWIDKIGLESRLEYLLSSGIIEINRCYFLQALLPEGFNIEEAVKSAFDRTELECEINHIHIDDFIELSKENTKVLLEQSIRYAFLLQNRLPPTVDFKVILACTFDPMVDCNVRFHKQRLGEDWLANDIDNYSEALLVLDSSH